MKFGTRSANGTVNTSFPLLTDSQYRSLVGRSFDNTRDIVLAMNADESVGKFVVIGTFATSGTIYASVDKAYTGWYRINFMIMAGR